MEHITVAGLVLFFVGVQLTYALELDCKKNEFLNECASTCPVTCRRPESPPCTAMCIRACDCLPNFIRSDETGECISIEECQKSLQCSENEMQTNCMPACEPTCKNPKQGCAPSTCFFGCICKSGFVRDALTNRCIPEENCPTECTSGEEWRNCSDFHCRETCQTSKPTHCIESCTPGCSCKKNFIYDDILQACVPYRLCAECGKNQEWQTCANIECRETCQHLAILSCPKACASGCWCKKGYIWDESRNTCVSPKDCSTDCGFNEYYSNCPSNCPMTCQNRCQDTINGPYCTQECTRPACICKDGYIRDEISKKCVLPIACPEKLFCNSDFEELDICKNPCLPTCSEPNRKPCPTFACDKGCVCKSGLIRNDKNGECILRKHCPV